jgi:energy-coupling factor transport system ATP-binding protein
MSRKPTVLALDEPTRGLDSGSAQLLREVLSCVVETGTALIIATHNHAFTDVGSDRVLSLREGKLWESPAGVSR